MRFSPNRQPSPLRGLLVSICVFIILFSVFFGAVDHFSKDTKMRQKEALENALHQGVVFCYTLEGSYPENLEYLKEHYGLTYNEHLFFVDYRLQGANIMPDITIIERGK